MEGSNRDKLDYPSILFRQLDRLGDLFCNGQYRTTNGTFYSHENAFNGLMEFESLVKYKLSEKDRADFLNEKVELKINDIIKKKINVSAELNQVYLDLLMKYVFKSNLLPADRKGVDSYDREESII